MKGLTIVLMFLFLCTLPCTGYTKPRVTVEGVIVDYNKKTVTLSQDGKKITVPRKSIPHYFKIKKGSKVYAELNAEEEIKKIQKAIKESDKRGKKWK